MKLPRFLHQFYAWLMGYFWIPCPICREYFGGHELTNWKRLRTYQLQTGHVICDACAAQPDMIIYDEAGEVTQEQWLKLSKLSSKKD